MKEIIEAILNAPIATIFVVAGLLFLGIAVVGKIIGKIEPGQGGRIASGVIGIILLSMGILMYLNIIPVGPPPDPTETPTPTLTPPEPSKTPTPTITPQVPMMYDFSACLEPCTGSNTINVFPEATERIYVEWEFENIPIGADYARVWSMDGQEWVRYQCTWPGPSNGTDMVSLREPDGLHSGIWKVTITVNGMVLLEEHIQVEGNWTY